MPRSKFADRRFWVDAGDRAIVSFAQGLLATGVLESTGVIGVDWQGVLSLAAGYSLTSFLSSIAFRDSTKE